MIFPAELGNGWSCPEFERMDDNVEAELGVTDYLLCTYVNREQNEIANVYVGYHVTQVREDGGGAENSIHPPAHCLPGSGWDIIRNETVPLDIPGLPQENATAKRLVIAKGNQRNLVYYWYQSRGRVISQDWQKIVFVGLDRATRQRTDGSLIRITVPMRRSGEAVAQAVFDSIAPEIVSRLSEYVPE
jgi:EpsI family protein